MKDLFNNEIIQKPLLRDKFIEPPFSVLDSKKGAWRNRVNKWKRLGLKVDDRMVNDVLKVKTKSGILNSDTKNTVKGHVLNEGNSIFDPALCELMYNWFCPVGGNILDPFAGGVVRGGVASYLGYKYTGIDIRKEQIDSNVERCLNILELNNQPKYYCGDSNIILNNEFENKFNLVFSCPPYAYLEKYSDLDGDISNMNYDDFLLAYKSILKKSAKHLMIGGFMIMVVGEVRDKKGNYIGFVPDTVNAMKEAGLSFYNECIYLQGLAGACLVAGRSMDISRKIKKVHQNVLIFKKQY